MVISQEFEEKFEKVILSSNSVNELEEFIINEYNTLKNDLTKIGVQFGEGYNEAQIISDNILKGNETYLYNEFLVISYLWQFQINNREISREEKYQSTIDIYKVKILEKLKHLAGT
jgi:hypothetical protein